MMDVLVCRKISQSDAFSAQSQSPGAGVVGERGRGVRGQRVLLFATVSF